MRQRNNKANPNEGSNMMDQLVGERKTMIHYDVRGSTLQKQHGNGIWIDGFDNTKNHNSGTLGTFLSNPGSIMRTGRRLFETYGIS
jgi:hypothetical protein